MTTLELQLIFVEKFTRAEKIVKTIDDYEMMRINSNFIIEDIFYASHDSFSIM